MCRLVSLADFANQTLQTSFFGRCLIAVCVRYNAEILRQFSSYGEVYRKEGNSSAHGTEKDCLLCVGDEKCELCYLKSKYKDELKSVTERDELYRLSDLSQHICLAQALSNVIPTLTK